MYILSVNIKDEKAWLRFLANRIINEYTSIVKKYNVDWYIIPPVEFGQITMLLFFNVISMAIWKNAIENRIKELA